MRTNDAPWVRACVGMWLCLGSVGRAASDGPVTASIPNPERVDAAIDRGLAYLSDTQSPDGSFGGGFGKTTGIVSLAGLAFLAKGYSPRTGPYQEAIVRCIEYDLAHQTEYGFFGMVAGGKMYSHNITALFLSEVSGMTDEALQKRIDGALNKATALILRAQRPVVQRLGLAGVEGGAA